MILYGIPGVRKFLLIFQELLFSVLYGRRLGNGARIFGWPIVAIEPGSKIEFGKGVMLISSSYFSEPGVNHPVVLRTITSHARIQIGNDVGISGGGICAAEEVILGDNVMLGANVFVTDTDFHPVSPIDRRYRRSGATSKPVVIEENVFIGMNSLVLKGVRIGTNSVIAAGSIVVSDIPSDSLAGGIPAKVIRALQHV